MGQQYKMDEMLQLIANDMPLHLMKPTRIQHSLCAFLAPQQRSSMWVDLRYGPVSITAHCQLEGSRGPQNVEINFHVVQPS